MLYKNEILTLLLLLFTLDLSYSQENSIYKNEELYRGEAIVFSKNYNPPIKLPSDIQIYTPNEEDILLAEKILNSKFNSDIAFGKKIRNVKEKFWKYNRQYIGYIDSFGNRLIVINLLNFDCRRKSQRKFEGWQTSFFIGFGEFYEKNSIRFVANLNSYTLSLL